METGAVEFLNNLKRPLWSIYCTMPSHQSLLIDNIIFQKSYPQRHY